MVVWVWRPKPVWRDASWKRRRGERPTDAEEHLAILYPPLTPLGLVAVVWCIFCIFWAAQAALTSNRLVTGRDKTRERRERTINGVFDCLCVRARARAPRAISLPCSSPLPALTDRSARMSQHAWQLWAVGNDEET